MRTIITTAAPNKLLNPTVSIFVVNGDNEEERFATIAVRGYDTDDVSRFTDTAERVARLMVREVWPQASRRILVRING